VTDLQARFGAIDIYLFDQLLRGQIRPHHRVCDAGCGSGRNLQFLLAAGGAVYGLDPDPSAVESVRALAARLAPGLPSDNFRCEPVEASSFPDGLADVVISSAVLHFAEDDDEFAGMLAGTWRLVAPGGLLFCRLASTIGVESLIRPLGAGGGRRYHLPDGTDRYLVDGALLHDWTDRLDGRLLDPLKTTVVEDRRAMTTWVVRRIR